MHIKSDFSVNFFFGGGMKHVILPVGILGGHSPHPSTIAAPESDRESRRRRCHRVHHGLYRLFINKPWLDHDVMNVQSQSPNLESICGCPSFLSSLLHVTSTSTYSSRIFCYLFNPAFGQTIPQKKPFSVFYLIYWRQYVVKTLLFVCCLRLFDTVESRSQYFVPPSGTVTDQFFRSYLHGRSQYVYCSMHGSSSVQLICRVPQCSVLGPVLFIVYTADLIILLIEQHSFCTHFYADDMQVYGCSRPSATYDLQQYLSACIDNVHVHSWMQLGMLNDNRKIDYRNGFSFSFSCLCYGFSEMGTCALAAVSEEWLLALLIIKLEPLTSVHTSQWAVLCRERWPGRRLVCPVCPVGLLGGRCNCRLSAGQDAVFSPPLPHRRQVAALLSRSGRRHDVHVVSHLLLTTHRSPRSSPHTHCGWMNVPVTDLFHWWRGEGDWPAWLPVWVPVVEGLLYNKAA